jgi:hypothetical protein
MSLADLEVYNEATRLWSPSAGLRGRSCSIDDMLIINCDYDSLAEVGFALTQ